MSETNGTQEAKKEVEEQKAQTDLSRPLDFEKPQQALHLQIDPATGWLMIAVDTKRVPENVAIEFLRGMAVFQLVNFYTGIKTMIAQSNSPGLQKILRGLKLK